MDPNVPLQEQTLVDNVTCGTADVNSDLDGDALNDFVETCLGTDPYEVDTDFDGITDTLEVAGLYLPIHWASPPHFTIIPTKQTVISTG